MLIGESKLILHDLILARKRGRENGGITLFNVIMMP